MMRTKRNQLVDNWTEETESVRVKLLVQIMDLEEEISEIMDQQKKPQKIAN